MTTIDPKLIEQRDAELMAVGKFDTPNLEAIGLAAPTPKAFADAITKRLNAKWQKKLDEEVAVLADNTHPDDWPFIASEIRSLKP